MLTSPIEKSREAAFRNVNTPGHSGNSSSIIVRCSFVLAFRTSSTSEVSALLFSAIKHSLDERPVVHAKCTEIHFLCKVDGVFLKNFLVGVHLDHLVVNDDAVEVEEEGFDHFRFKSSDFSATISRAQISDLPLRISVNRRSVIQIKNLRS